MTTKLDFQQIIKKVYNDVNNRLRVDAALTITEVEQEVIISDDSDSIKVGDGTGNYIKVNDDGSINITDNGESLTVDSTDFDIRDLNASQDNVAISDGTDTLEVNPDGSINSVVTATDLDIRDLDATQDNIAISDGVNTLEINNDGSVNTRILDENGDSFSQATPLEVSSNYEKIINIINQSNWLDLAVLDRIEFSSSVDRTSLTLLYYEDTFVIGEAIINYNSDIDWNFQLTRYLLDDDGSKLLDDDDIPLNLE